MPLISPLMPEPHILLGLAKVVTRRTLNRAHTSAGAQQSPLITDEQILSRGQPNRSTVVMCV